MGIIIVIALRILLPLTIFRWPLLGGFLSALADFFDFGILEKFGWDEIHSDEYQKMDKILDTFYLGIGFVALRKLRDKLITGTATLLFSWRLIGVAAFEITGIRSFLFFAPNIFEGFFFLIFIARKFRFLPEIKNQNFFAFFILLSGIIKLLHEYKLHVGDLRDLLNF
ncbi:MAG TPA: hypothetical protein DIT25_01115 [Candidatus Moranbacteria bacterium]|nr:hypothetical protein [Candidatus Moranbacteria bacterium]